MLQFGDFTHPNSPNRVEALHVLPTMTIPRGSPKASPSTKIPATAPIPGIPTAT